MVNKQRTERTEAEVDKKNADSDSIDSLICSCGICPGLISLIRTLICVCDAVPDAKFQLSKFLSRGCHQSKSKTPRSFAARVLRLYLPRGIGFGLFLVWAAAVNGLCQLLKLIFRLKQLYGSALILETTSPTTTSLRRVQWQVYSAWLA
jgi:hypothetical protein